MISYEYVNVNIFIFLNYMKISEIKSMKENQ